MPMRRESSPRPQLESDVTTYHVFWFDEVADAVECCGRLVPHVVTRGGLVPERANRPVVWFHVPRRATASTRDGCYLIASPGALAAFHVVAPEMRSLGTISRDAIPAASVLILGEDMLPTKAAPSFERARVQTRAVPAPVDAEPAANRRVPARLTPTTFTPVIESALTIH